MYYLRNPAHCTLAQALLSYIAHVMHTQGQLLYIVCLSLSKLFLCYFLFKLLFYSLQYFVTILSFEIYSCAATYFPLYCYVNCEFHPRGINKGPPYLILSCIAEVNLTQQIKDVSLL